MKIYDFKFRCFKKLYIGDSSIAGKGLFANEFIAKGEIIMSFGGVLAHVSDKYSGAYILSTFTGISEDVMVCESIDSEKDYSDYLNHSCNPNVGMDDCLTLVAIRDIAPDEELAYDYAFCEADENWKLKAICNCGEECCRKTITGIDWKNVTSKDKFFPYYSPFIKRRILRNEQEI